MSNFATRFVPGMLQARAPGLYYATILDVDTGKVYFNTIGALPLAAFSAAHSKAHLCEYNKTAPDEFEWNEVKSPA